MQGQSHALQNVGEPLNSPDADSQEAIRAPNGRKRTVGRFEDATLMWSFEAHIVTLKEQLSSQPAHAARVCRAGRSGCGRTHGAHKGARRAY